MMLILDNEAVAPAAYALPAGAATAAGVRPDPAPVKPLLARGATMVLNFIDQLTPELSAFARSLEEALGGHGAGQPLPVVQAQAASRRTSTSTTCSRCTSWARRPGACSRRAEHPIKHRASRAGRGNGTTRSRASCGATCLRPGDLLYLPRGQYHYALADDGPCVHVAWGVTYPIGMDVVSYAFERMVGEAIGRAEPRERGAPRRASRRSGGRWRNVSASPGARGHRPSCANFRWPRIATTCRT